MQHALFEVDDVYEQAGFRLHRFEVYNWGTFHGRVWSLTLDGNNGLVTGDIGSGKSTLVDGITTLLVPAHRIVYNKAAGAEARERSLRSYVLGYYKSERGDGSLSARPVALRGPNSYSVILGHFRSRELNQDVTLAQVFWMKEGQGQPARFYVVADRPLSIKDDFAGFGGDLADLRRRLRADPQVRVYDHFPPYGADFRRRFGLPGEQALELFNQTVSMKSVGNLTDFVREHMLEAFPAEERIEALIRHFEDLNRAHQAVVRARAQIEALEPLVADVDRYGQVAAAAEELRRCRNGLRPWFAHLKGRLLEERMERLSRELERWTAREGRLEQTRRNQDAQRDELKRAISDKGGDHMERLKREIQILNEEQRRRRERAEQYRRLALELGLDDVADEDGFLANREAAEKARATLEDRRADAQNALTETSVALRDLRAEWEAIQAELASLRSRRSNIPLAMLELRERLCQGTGLPEEELPFAGELLEVRQEAREWEGVIERLLHNFGLSLLVPDRHYRTVAEWVDRVHLRGRLVYYRVRERAGAPLPELHPRSLVHKLAIRPDSEFYPWLEQELARRFDYACCDDVEQFRREQRAVTRAGQIKDRGERHEKDDRHAIDDRSRYVLGWTNELKIAALEEQAAALERRMQEAARRFSEAQREQDRLQRQIEAMAALLAFGDFHELDWRSVALEAARLQEELDALTAASDRLRVLQDQLTALEQAMAATEEALKEARDERARRRFSLEQAERLLDEARSVVEAMPEEERAALFPRLEALRAEILGDQPLTVESCDRRESDMREELQRRIDAEDKRLQRLGQNIIDGMRRFHNAWPLETRDVDVSLEAADEYRRMLHRLQADDLPRFETRFRELLRENTIREVAAFQAQLKREAEAIRERIAVINGSLRSIDYNPNRYIALLAEPTSDPEVRDFQQDLRACTEGVLTGSDDDQYSEAKFHQVKAIIERFQGREGQSDLDRRWTRKVTDVRNWFVFSASERWREDDSEHEHYMDSGGKSAGQKEKLAYTVLAASLAYQFRLEGAAPRARSFRFVVIDEAFGRGSDESARYALELFRRMKLQVLVVTPLQKIHVIEPYVANVAFVYNEDGRRSLVRNLTIDEYRAEREARRMVHVS